MRETGAESDTQVKEKWNSANLRAFLKRRRAGFHKADVGSVSVSAAESCCETNSLPDEMLPQVYRELRRLAAQCMRRDRPGHTLQPTALVHEAYLRLTRCGLPPFQDKVHFVNIVVRLMRQILVEHGRRRSTARRGSGSSPLPLLDSAVGAEDASRETIALHEGLDVLAREDERKSLIVEYRYFGGFTTAEIASLTGLCTRTVERELKSAYEWLFHWVTCEGRHA